MAKSKSRQTKVESKQDDLLLRHDLEVLQGITESKDKYRRITQAAIAQWVKDFQNGDIEIKTVEDLKKLIELDLQLQADDDY